MPIPPILGPVALTAVGQAFVGPAQIRAVLWEGVTTVGDTCELRARGDNRLLFPGRATSTQTWQGVVLEMTCPEGFILTQLSAGRVLVYLAEPDAV